MSLDPEFNASVEHLANIIRSAEAARADLEKARAVISHCAVEIIIHQSRRFLVGPKLAAERARLFALWDEGKIKLAIGGGRVAFEMAPEDAFPKSRFVCEACAGPSEPGEICAECVERSRS